MRAGIGMGAFAICVCTYCAFNADPTQIYMMPHLHNDDDGDLPHHTRSRIHRAHPFHLLGYPHIGHSRHGHLFDHSVSLYSTSNLLH